jgi:hypothetical protein
VAAMCIDPPDFGHIAGAQQAIRIRNRHLRIAMKLVSE